MARIERERAETLAAEHLPNPGFFQLESNRPSGLPSRAEQARTQRRGRRLLVGVPGSAGAFVRPARDPERGARRGWPVACQFEHAIRATRRRAERDRAATCPFRQVARDGFARFFSAARIANVLVSKRSVVQPRSPTKGIFATVAGCPSEGGQVTTPLAPVSARRRLGPAVGSRSGSASRRGPPPRERRQSPAARLCCQRQASRIASTMPSFARQPSSRCALSALA